MIGVVTFIFAIMAYFYKYVNLSESEEPTDDDKQDESTALIRDEQSKYTIHDKSNGTDQEPESKNDENEF